jgi:hypothetical protein
MREFGSNQEFLATVRRLIDRWCDERKLNALSRILPAYLAFNGLSDGWHELLAALKTTRAIGHDAFDQAEWDTLNDLIHAVGVTLEKQSTSQSDAERANVPYPFGGTMPVWETIRP